MTNVRFEIEQVEKLAIDPHSGKFRLVVREPAVKQTRTTTTTTTAAAPAPMTPAAV